MTKSHGQKQALRNIASYNCKAVAIAELCQMTQQLGPYCDIALREASQNLVNVWQVLLVFFCTSVGSFTSTRQELKTIHLFVKDL